MAGTELSELSRTSMFFQTEKKLHLVSTAPLKIFRTSLIAKLAHISKIGEALSDVQFPRCAEKISHSKFIFIREITRSTGLTELVLSWSFLHTSHAPCKCIKQVQNDADANGKTSRCSNSALLT